MSVNEDEENLLLDGEPALPTQDDDLGDQNEDADEDTGLDDWGNPVGTEYDDDGWPLDDAGNPIGKPEEEDEAKAPKTAARPPATIANLGPSLTDEEIEAEAAWAGLTVEQYKGIQGLIQREASRMTRASMVSNSYYQQEAESNPSFYKTYGGKVQELMAQSNLPADQLAKREVIIGAASGVLYTEVMENNITIEQAILKMADAIRGGKPEQKKSVVPVRREQRVPTPAVSRPTTAPRTMNRRTTSPKKDILEDIYGLNPSEKNIVLASDERFTRSSR